MCYLIGVGDQRRVALGQVAVRVRRAEAAAAGDAHAGRQPREPGARAVGGRHRRRGARASRLST